MKSTESGESINGSRPDGSERAEADEPKRPKPSQRAKQRGITKDIDLIRKVAQITWGFSGRIWPTTDEVKGEMWRRYRLELSKGVISRLQRKAIELGFVTRPRFLEPCERQYLLELGEHVRAKYSLQRVLVVPGHEEMLGTPTAEQGQSLHAAVVQAMVEAFAPELDELLAKRAANASARDPFLVGVAWGRTLAALARHLRSTRRPTLRHLRVAPIIGDTDEWTAEPVEATDIARLFAEAYAGHAGRLSCSAFLWREFKESTLAPQVRAMLKTIRDHARIIISSLGPIEGVSDANEIVLSIDPEMNRSLFESARRAGAVGEINGWWFDKEGRPVTTDWTAVGLGYRRLREMAHDPTRLVAILCGGDARRIEPLRGALRGRLCSMLVTDHVTAEALRREP